MVTLTTKKHLFEVNGIINDSEPVSVFLLEDSIHDAIEFAEKAVEELTVLSCHQIDDNTRHVVWLFDKTTLEAAN